MRLERPSSRPAMPLARGGVPYGLSPTTPNAAGWGLIDEAATLDTTVLQEAFLAILPDAECAGFDATYDANSQTCAYTRDVAGVCRGDSGGPLTVLDAAGVPHLWGVTSYGTQLDHGLAPCSRKAPAVFSWVPAFSGWIDAHTSEILPPPGPQPQPPPTAPGPGTQQPSPTRPLPSAPRDTTAPALTGARLSTKTLRAARRGAMIARSAGARLSFKLSEAAAVRVSVLKGRKALSPSATIAGQAGRTTKRFTGRLGARKLKPGRYRLRLAAVDAAGNAGTTRTLRFRVVR
jgi:hypothetical protein